MSKKRYRSPFLMELNPEDPTIVIGPSQGSSGYDSIWSFVGIDEETQEQIGIFCDDFDLDEMDANDDFIITAEEFTAWADSHEGWDEP